MLCVFNDFVSLERNAKRYFGVVVVPFSNRALTYETHKNYHHKYCAWSTIKAKSLTKLFEGACRYPYTCFICCHKTFKLNPGLQSHQDKAQTKVFFCCKSEAL